MAVGGEVEQLPVAVDLVLGDRRDRRAQSADVAEGVDHRDDDGVDASIRGTVGHRITSASGNLQYEFQVVSGGLQPALLQSPTNPKATVDFVNGPGLYLVQLTVTDASGKTSTSPVIMLTYQP